MPPDLLQNFSYIYLNQLQTSSAKKIRLEKNVEIICPPPFKFLAMPQRVTIFLLLTAQRKTGSLKVIKSADVPFSAQNQVKCKKKKVITSVDVQLSKLFTQAKKRVGNYLLGDGLR